MENVEYSHSIMILHKSYVWFNLSEAPPLVEDEAERFVKYHDYRVSDKGRVINRFGNEVKGYLANKNGYPCVVLTLRIDGKRVTRHLGQLVWQCFNSSVQNANARTYHIDGNPQNCTLDNLKVCSAHTQDRTPQQIKIYEQNVFAVVKSIFDRLGYFDTSKYGFDIENVMSETYLLIYKYLAQYKLGTSFYRFCKTYAKYAFTRAYKQWKNELEVQLRLVDNYAGRNKESS